MGPAILDCDDTVEQSVNKIRNGVEINMFYLHRAVYLHLIHLTVDDDSSLSEKVGSLPIYVPNLEFPHYH